MKYRKAIVSVWIALSAQASAISVTIDYQNPSDTFFNATAQSTLAKAASDVSFAITTTLTALSQDVYAGTSGSSSATVNWRLNYTDPTNGSTTVTQNTFSFAENEFVIKVGSRSLGGSTLGVGGAAGAGIGLGGSDAGGGTFALAVDEMEALSNASMRRGGPILKTLSGTLGSANFDLNYGYALGALAFDNDAGTNWHFDYNTLPGTGQNDFYSVAVHEILHALGIGGGSTWTSNVSGTNWLGSAVQAALGSGTDVLDGDGDHVKSGLTGFAIIDGVQTEIVQEVAMDPTITTGQRKYLTNVDLAFLNDMGWQVIPEPSHVSLLLISVCGFLLRRRR